MKLIFKSNCSGCMDIVWMMLQHGERAEMKFDFTRCGGPSTVFQVVE